MPELVKSFHMRVSNNQVLIVITKMLHFHYEKDRGDERKALNSQFLQKITKD